MSWKLATFNVNGIRARLDLLKAWLADNGPDAVCLQETKAPDESFPAAALEELGYHVAVHGQKSFNGVAVLTRNRPDEVFKGWPDGWSADQARLIWMKIDGLWLVNTYVPQGRDPDNPAFQYKLEFLSRLGDWFGERWKPSDRLIWTGDINVAPEPLDVYDPDRLDGQVGFHPEERKALGRLVDWGFTDLFRRHHPGERQFSFWDYRMPKGFQRNLGWRIDHILVTSPLAELSLDCWVDAAPRSLAKPSDHTPVLAELAL